MVTAGAAAYYRTRVFKVRSFGSAATVRFLLLPPPPLPPTRAPRRAGAVLVRSPVRWVGCGGCGNPQAMFSGISASSLVALQGSSGSIGTYAPHGKCFLRFCIFGVFVRRLLGRCCRRCCDMNGRTTFDNFSKRWSSSSRTGDWSIARRAFAVSLVCPCGSRWALYSTGCL